MLISVTENITELRKQLHQYVEENRNALFTQMSFRKRKRRDGSVKGKTRDEYIDGIVLSQIWYANINFKGGCSVDYWLYVDSMFP